MSAESSGIFPVPARPVLVLTGTTASGKDATAVAVAEAIGGEVITLDSMKVYRGMDVGTDKPTRAERREVRHHLVDGLAPDESMNLRRYVDSAWAVVKDIQERGREAILTGGTALYLKGFLHGVFDGPAADHDLRAALRAEYAALGAGVLHKRLRSVDPVAAARLHPNDRKRIERALEVHALTGRNLSDQLRGWHDPVPSWACVVILTWPREVLYDRINTRVERMFEGGILEETASILGSGGFGPQSSQALGYAEAQAVLAGTMTKAAAVERVQARTRQFARKQLTWFRSLQGAQWIEGTRETGIEQLTERVLRLWQKRSSAV
jgi:tRNA dimethylallyltransferase